MRTFAAGMALGALIALVCSTAFAFQVKRAGKLEVSAGTRILPFSTDPVVQRVLREDLDVAGRAPSAVARAPITLTVTVTQRELKPGVSMQDLAPGDPQVAQLIEQAGLKAPPIGDTGDEFDQAARARHLMQSSIGPSDTPMEQALNSIQAQGSVAPPEPEASAQPMRKLAPGEPGYTGDTQAYMQQGQQARQYANFYHHDSGSYDVVVVARASISGSPGEMTVVGVAQPNEDVRAMKQLIAETIAGALLH